MVVDEKWNKKLKDFLKRYHQDDILELANSYPDKRSLTVNYDKLEVFDRDIARDLMEDPESVILSLEFALKDMDLPTSKNMENAHVRVINIPNRIPIRDLRSKHLSKFIAIEGMIRRATEVRPRITKAAFKCMRCDTITYVEQPGNKLDEPYSGCENENCGKRGPFKLVIEQSEFIDSQKGQIQESPESLKGGSNPQSIEINFNDDLTGQISPGDRVIVNGILRSVPRALREGKSTFYDLVLDANSIERLDQEYDELDITAEEEEQILELSRDPEVYDKIVASIAPTIYGNEHVKRALMYQLFSGVVKQFPDGTRTRGDIHVILVGDPGVAKSQLLRYIVKLSPRGVFASGKSASASGLTAAAVKDDMGDGRWTIEGGALVMADMGIAAVDEMDKMRDEDKSSLHEAMEQQTISIAKAGIIATLKSRCALLGAANPVYGRFNRYESLADQIDMPPALLSRFDLIFLLLDVPESQMDTKIAEHVLQTHYAGELMQHKNNISSSDITQEYIDSQMTNVIPEIDPDLLRKYVAYSRRNVYPIMDDDARMHLVDFYTSLRKQGEGKNTPIPVTARQLEALIRLAEASARVRLSNRVTMDDAIRTTDITMECLKNVGIDPTTGMLDASIINSGVSQSQRDKIGVVKDIIRTISERSQGGVASRKEVQAEAEKSGISAEELEVYIHKMSSKGDIYSPPGSDGYKLSSK
ncbi:minichromosome maintenance protein MCM [Methanimicrococcus blatticola]|uniref:DNA helicase n=1 Tax=Methanimicrococcus blatticola TaxID=91560 RepID=A0A484F656_9EURY|nr:minichromosome maintenance protein MCM [Methanimicrococcus blatticola]MCC2509163.1 minichromosome maintenance protein MCM [Methanimicrococcus blatticola]TDQ69472.1 replicative DNA helicase Mcm [Methanimicrococcus blatticola]